MKTMPQMPELTAKIAASLGRCLLFQGMEEKELQDAAAQAKLVQVEQGEYLTREGSTPDAFFAIVNGQASVLIRHAEKKEDIEIAQIGPGETVGEIALLTGKSYAASVKASSRLVAARFEAAFFESMVQNVPEFGLKIAKAMGHWLQQLVQMIPVPEFSGKQESPPERIIQLFPIEFMKRHRVLPLVTDGNLLTVGFVDNPSPPVLESIRNFVPGMELRPVRVESQLFENVMRTHTGTAVEIPPAAEGREDEVKEAELAASLSLDRYLQDMVREGASDLHLSAGQRPRWRIDGLMHEIADAPKFGTDTAFELLEPVIDERYSNQFRQTNDADFALTTATGARFRVNLFRDVNGAGAVFRHITNRIPALEQLGMPEIVTRFCEEPKGLILVTGPTGCGKSTTLAAMVDMINNRRKEHIITLEDPVEFIHPSRQSMVNQREVGSHTQSFSRALRAALREDPDIVLVGEMRDLETVSLALETANTGHLVLATLHTATAVLTVDRVVGLFPADQQNQIRSVLSDVLRGVICQNLCRRIGGGRIAALEILVVNPAVSNLIREGKTNQIPSAMQMAKAQGNLLLNDSLADLVKSGKVEPEEALSKAVDKKDLERRLPRT